jgi:hypothetical protein
VPPADCVGICSRELLGIPSLPAKLSITVNHKSPASYWRINREARKCLLAVALPDYLLSTIHQEKASEVETRQLPCISRHTA